MVIAGTKGKLVVIGVLGTHAPLDLLQLLFEAARSIPETLEDTSDRAHIIVFLDDTLLIVFLRLPVILLGNSGNP